MHFFPPAFPYISAHPKTGRASQEPAAAVVVVAAPPGNLPPPCPPARRQVTPQSKSLLPLGVARSPRQRRCLRSLRRGQRGGPGEAGRQGGKPAVCGAGGSSGPEPVGGLLNATVLKGEIDQEGKKAEADLSICWKGREKNNPLSIFRNRHDFICCQNHSHTSAAIVFAGC